MPLGQGQRSFHCEDLKENILSIQIVLPLPVVKGSRIKFVLG